MIYGIYVVRDRLTVYGAPMILPGDAAALRAVQHALKDPASMYSTAPQDYDLCRLGLYDDDTGAITLEQAGIHVVANLATIKIGGNHA